MLIRVFLGLSVWDLSSRQHLLSALLGSPSGIGGRNAAEHVASRLLLTSFLLQPEGTLACPFLLPFPNERTNSFFTAFCTDASVSQLLVLVMGKKREAASVNAGHAFFCAHRTCSWTGFHLGALQQASLIGGKIRCKPSKNKQWRIPNDLKVSFQNS